MGLNCLALKWAADIGVATNGYPLKDGLAG